MLGTPGSSPDQQPVIEGMPDHLRTNGREAFAAAVAGPEASAEPLAGQTPETPETPDTATAEQLASVESRIKAAGFQMLQEVVVGRTTDAPGVRRPEAGWTVTGVNEQGQVLASMAYPETQPGGVTMMYTMEKTVDPALNVVVTVPGTRVTVSSPGGAVDPAAVIDGYDSATGLVHLKARFRGEDPVKMAVPMAELALMHTKLAEYRSSEGPGYDTGPMDLPVGTAIIVNGSKPTDEAGWKVAGIDGRSYVLRRDASWAPGAYDEVREPRNRLRIDPRPYSPE
jgi:hypothetical protein